MTSTTQSEGKSGESKDAASKAKTKSTPAVPALPPLEASARRLERLFGGSSDSATGKQASENEAAKHSTSNDGGVKSTANPGKVVRRWLGTSSGASGSARMNDIIKASATLLEPTKNGRIILEKLGQKIPDIVKADEDDAKEEVAEKETSTKKEEEKKEEAMDVVTSDAPLQQLPYLEMASNEIEAWLLSLAIRRLWRIQQKQLTNMEDSSTSTLDVAFELSNASLTVVSAYIEESGIAANFSASGLYPLMARLFRLRSLVVESMPLHIATPLQEQMRPELVACHRSATIRRDADTQSTILNILLHDLLQNNQVEQAQKLLTKSTFPDDSSSSASSTSTVIGGTASNNQVCRYLYHSGRIQALRLEYTSSYTNLSQALRKAPTNTGLGFRIAVQRLLVVVQLLMGEIPERAIFFQEGMIKELKPYLRISQAVRRGDLAIFNQTVAAHQQRFTEDRTHTLISRLAHSVVKAGLRRLNVSYSRISLQDIATRLGLPSATSAEYVVAKAVRDGVIDCTIDHTEGVVVSHDLVDIYASMEPSEAFHRRIAFCLATHNDAVRGMRYPPDAYKRELEKSRGNKSKKDADEKTDEEMAKELEDELDEEY